MLNRREWIRLASVATLAAASGCGTILYPERRGQPHGRLDWGVVLLDGLGLIFFFIPGIIAFAVDFATGAIYLPPEHYVPGVPLYGTQLRRIKTDTPEPTLEQVETVVSRAIAQPIQLETGVYHTEPLAQLDDFWRCHHRHHETHTPPG
jgi:hypothetical protein